MPHRIKNFFWKCVVSILPTKDRLLSRYVPLNDDLYDLCRGERETCFHVIIGCDFARDVLEFYLEEG